MLRIITHIERLLLVHDCVILPKFGGFVLQSIPSVFDGNEHLFRPSRKEIRFNVTLQHNDGLLGESYMKMYGINYRQAQLMLEEDIDDMKAALLQYKKLSLGVLGAFNVGKEGQLIFMPDNTDLFSIETYGLPPFHFPYLVSLQTEKEETVFVPEKNGKKDVLYIPVSRKLLRTAIATAAAVALFLLVSTPVKDVNQAAYTASFVPSEMVAGKTAPIENSISEVIFTPVNEPVETLSDKEETAPSLSEVKKQEIPVVAIHEKKELKINPKMYHIVIASFPTESQADEYIAGVDKTICKHASKVVRDGKYRIYADKFDNREQAETYMATLRSYPKYKDAWLFISR